MSKPSPEKPRLLGYDDFLPIALTVQKSFEDTRKRLDELRQAGASNDPESAAATGTTHSALADLEEELYEIGQCVNDLLYNRIDALRQSLTTLEGPMRHGRRNGAVGRATNAVATAFGAADLLAQPQTSGEEAEARTFEEACVAVAGANGYEIRAESGGRFTLITLTRNGLHFSLQVSPIPSILGMAGESRIDRLVVSDERSGEEVTRYERRTWSKVSTDPSTQSEIDRVIAIFA